MSDRVAIMRGGRLVQVDEPRRLHDHPADSFVASFIGEATLLPVERIDGSSVSLAGTRLRSSRAVPTGKALLLAVQSEKLLIGGGDGRNLLAGQVTDIVYQGESLRVFLILDDGTSLSLRQPSHFEALGAIPAVGQRLSVSLHPEDTIVVPKAGE